MKKLLSVFLAAAMLLSAAPLVSAAEAETVVLYTNDVHCAIDDYSVLAAYRAELIAQGKNVVTVDAGDAIQGEVIGALTEGAAVVDIMNTVGYDYAVPGNHEFDYGMDVFLDIAQDKADYEYLSSNFWYLPSVSPVLSRYAVEDFGDYQVAFVGISTPETITKSTPEFFKGEGGNYIYGFPVYPGGLTNEILYENIQQSVDAAVADGADIVVAVGHTGIAETTDGWKSTDIIANTNGIDYFIDAHSHETIESAVYKNKDNTDVVLTSTGTKFANFGVLTISDGNASFELVNPDDVKVETLSADAKAAHATVKEKIDGYKDEIAYLYEAIGTSEAKLVTYNADKSWAVRMKETNAGDFVTDAYRAVTGADVAVANGGGVRGEVEIGDVSRKTLMDMNPFGNDMCVLEVTGQQLIDVLEHGARNCPEPLGGFFQVSGVTFEIHAYRESPVITDQLGDFIEIDEDMMRRVQNVYVGGEEVDLEKTYTLVGSKYVLTQGGDGLTMLEDATVVQAEGLPCDNEMLIKYFTETLDGVIPADKYGNPDGEGRITVIEESPNKPEHDYEIEYGEELTVEIDVDDGAYVRFTPEKDTKFILRSESEDCDPGCELLDANGEYLDFDYTDDVDDGLDFCLSYKFKAGKTYYFYVTNWGGESASYTIYLECGHAYVDGVCDVCGDECDHSEAASLGYCGCGEFFLGKDIAYGEELELEVDANDTVFVRFVCEEDRTLVFRSHSENTDIGCSLYDSDEEFLSGDYFDDDDNSVNIFDFSYEYDFAAGETYYFEVYTYENEETVSFSVSLGCSHSYEDGVCVYCDEECDHSKPKKLGYCGCGEFFVGKDISVGDEIEADMTDTYRMWFRFVPEESGLYIFESLSESEETDPDAYIYTEEDDCFDSDTDSNENGAVYDFYLPCELEAGVAYYYEVRSYVGGTSTLKLSRGVHTDENGNVHDLKFIDESYSDCLNHGYTAGLYCPICEEFISGHEEKELDNWHYDDDENNLCDVCGCMICTHFCHFDNWFINMIWQIVNFFQMLFGINPVCECGAYHYEF